MHKTRFYIIMLINIFAGICAYTQISAGKKSIKTNKMQIDKFKLIIYQAFPPTAKAIEYVITNEDLVVYEKTRVKDAIGTVLFQKKIGSSETLLKLSQTNLQHLEDRYINYQILDGIIFTIQFKKASSSASKNIILSNYYHPDIAAVFENVNRLLPEKYKIIYPKE